MSSSGAGKTKPCLLVLSPPQSPLFLLFLNCVWQLMEQHPAAFEFTETYLIMLSDSMWVPVFSTFLFNCPRQRAEHSRVRHEVHGSMVLSSISFFQSSSHSAFVRYKQCYLKAASLCLKTALLLLMESFTGTFVT